MKADKVYTWSNQYKDDEPEIVLHVKFDYTSSVSYTISIKEAKELVKDLKHSIRECNKTEEDNDEFEEN